MTFTGIPPEVDPTDPGPSEADAPAKPGKTPQLTDREAALRFLSHHDGTLRYDFLADTWLWYQKARGWYRTTAAPVLAAISSYLASASAGMSGMAKIAMESRGKASSVKFMVSAMVELDKNDRFEEAPGLVGLPNGLCFEFRTGQIREQTPADRISRSLGVMPDPDMQTPVWDRFLQETFKEPGGGQPAIDCLISYLGYGLTEETREHRFMFAKGAPASGKSTLASMISYIWADYCYNAATETFIRTGKFQDHPASIASLEGYRMVLIPDAGKGRFEDVRLSTFVCGEKQNARFMARNPFEFVPVGKVYIASTYTPTTSGPSSGVGRRMMLLEHTHHLPKEKRDTQLLDKLKAEAPGILSKLLKAACDWYEHGLVQPPETMEDAAAAMLEGSDRLGDWPDSRLLFREGAWCTAAALRDSYESWCKSTDTDPVSKQQFRTLVADNLASRGVVFQGNLPRSTGRRTSRGWVGVQIVGADMQDSGYSGEQEIMPDASNGSVDRGSVDSDGIDPERPF